VTGDPAWRAREGGVQLHVRATPKASRNAVKGVEAMADGRSVLAVAVCAPPADGEANAELLSFLAKTLGVRRSAITLDAGSTSRVKRLTIAGDSGEIIAKLAAMA
jgi:hypothetical protein